MINNLKIFLLILLTSCISDKKEKLIELKGKAEKEFISSRSKFDNDIKTFKALKQRKVIPIRLERLKNIYITSNTTSAKEEMDNFVELRQIIIEIEECHRRILVEEWRIKRAEDDKIYMLWEFADKLQEEIEILSTKINTKDRFLLKETKKIILSLKDTTDKRLIWLNISRDYNQEVKSPSQNRPNESQKYGPVYLVS